MARRLPKSFFQRKTPTVAQQLLGCTLVHLVNGHRISGRIIETEAYLGVEDRACHSFGNRRTVRTESLYRPGGHAYVYLIYGMYFCFNVVTRDSAHPEAVLIRALEPIEGIHIMRTRRNVKVDRDLANGPGKLCIALGINLSHDRLPLQKSSLIIEEASPEHLQVIESPRIGVDYAGECAKWPLRFSVANNVHVSKPYPWTKPKR